MEADVVGANPVLDWGWKQMLRNSRRDGRIVGNSSRNLN